MTPSYTPQNSQPYNPPTTPAAGFVSRGDAVRRARAKGHHFPPDDEKGAPTDGKGTVISCQYAPCWASLTLVDMGLADGNSSALQHDCPTRLSVALPRSKDGETAGGTDQKGTQSS